jgi:hypothetical protein
MQLLLHCTDVGCTFGVHAALGRRKLSPQDGGTGLASVDDRFLLNAAAPGACCDLTEGVHLLYQPLPVHVCNNSKCTSQHAACSASAGLLQLKCTPLPQTPSHLVPLLSLPVLWDPPIQPADRRSPAPTQRQQQPTYSPPRLHNQPHPYNEPPPVYPSAPQAPEQAYPPPKAHQQQPQPPPQQLPPQQQRPGSSAGVGRGSSSGSSNPANGSSKPDWWAKPWKLLDSAVQKVDSAVQSIASDLGSNTCAGCGRAMGLGPTLAALGKQWHVGCFR